MRKWIWAVALLLVLTALAPAVGIATEDGSEVTLSTYVDYTWFPVNSFEGIIPDAIKEATGVGMDVTVSTDDSQLGLMIASGDLPDLVYCWYNSNNALRLMNDELSYSYEDLIREYCPDWDVEADYGPIVKTMRSLSPDGKFYALFDGYQSEESWSTSVGAPAVPTLYYRRDILRDLNLEVPKTVDELIEVYDAVQAAYPDKVLCAMDVNHRYNVFLSWMGLPGTAGLMMDGEDIVYATNHSAFEEAMRFVNSLYRKGCFLDENFAYSSENDVYELLSSDRAFSWTYCSTSVYERANEYSRATNANADWWILPNLNGEKSVFQMSTGGGWTSTFITKSCEDPEAAIRLMRYLFSEEGIMTSLCGRPGVEWSYTDGGVSLSDELIASLSATGNDAYINKYNWRFAFGCSAPMQTFVSDYIATATDDLLEINNSLKAISTFHDELNYLTPEADSDEAVALSKLDNYMTTAAVKLVMSTSDEDFQQNYDEIMRTCEQIGVAQLEESIRVQVSERMGE